MSSAFLLLPPPPGLHPWFCVPFTYGRMCIELSVTMSCWICLISMGSPMVLSRTSWSLASPSLHEGFYQRGVVPPTGLLHKDYFEFFLDICEEEQKIAGKCKWGSAAPTRTGKKAKLVVPASLAPPDPVLVALLDLKTTLSAMDVRILFPPLSPSRVPGRMPSPLACRWRQVGLPRSSPFICWPVLYLHCPPRLPFCPRLPQSRGIVWHKTLLGHRPLFKSLFFFQVCCAQCSSLLGYRNSPCLTHYTTVRGRKFDISFGGGIQGRLQPALTGGAVNISGGALWIRKGVV